jgi:hypothetical protein
MFIYTKKMLSVLIVMLAAISIASLVIGSVALSRVGNDCKCPAASGNPSGSGGTQASSGFFESVVYVSADRGSDDNPGTLQYPMKTVSAALSKVTGPTTINVEAGSYVNDIPASDTEVDADVNLNVSDGAVFTSDASMGVRSNFDSASDLRG